MPAILPILATVAAVKLAEKAVDYGEKLIVRSGVPAKLGFAGDDVESLAGESKASKASRSAKGLAKLIKDKVLGKKKAIEQDAALQEKEDALASAQSEMKLKEAELATEKRLAELRAEYEKREREAQAQKERAAATAAKARLIAMQRAHTASKEPSVAETVKTAVQSAIEAVKAASNADEASAALPEEGYYTMYGVPGFETPEPLNLWDM